MPRVFSYKVVRDYGFAPNPFFGACTLACCKPEVRQAARPGDLVIGSGGQSNNLLGRAIFAMRVSERLTFDQYWADPRFEVKKSQMGVGLRRGYGDNIYHHDDDGNWVQEYSHHSFPDGSLNNDNLVRDTSANAVLIGFDYIYWGALAPDFPAHLRDLDGDDISPRGRADRSRFSKAMTDAAMDWFQSIQKRAYRARPSGW